MPKLIDLSGQIFSRLTVVAQSGNHNRHAMWECVCECGRTVVTSGDKLRSGNTQSCGCLRLERLREKLSTHGQSASSNGGIPTKEYAAWYTMKTRCHTPTNKNYPQYGGRGIYVCGKWRDSFEAFFADMGKAPTKKHSIDRIDNDKGYSPENCRWVTQDVQLRNRRTTKLITFDGYTGTVADWARRTGIPRQTISRRIASGVGLDMMLSIGN